MPNLSQKNLNLLENAVARHFKASPKPAVPDQLYANILARLAYEQELQAIKPKLWAGFGLFAASLAVLVFALITSGHAFAQSHTWGYFSLLFTDFKTVMDNWQDYLFSILENLPLGATAFVLVSAAAWLWLTDFSVKQLKNFHHLGDAGHGQTYAHR